MKPRALLEGHRGDITAILFSANGKTVYTGGNDSTIKVWDVPDDDE